MKTVKKLIRDVQVGDCVQMEGGEFLRVRRIEKGVFTVPSVILEYQDGSWSCYPKAEEVFLKAK